MSPCWDTSGSSGTGTPEAGGLSSRELLATLRSFARLNLVGADIVEVVPSPRPNRREPKIMGGNPRNLTEYYP